MSESKINSKNYWDERFEKDWDEFGGKQQTEFFAHIACELLPEWFIRNLRANQYTLCDMGCALGNAVDVLSKFLLVNVTGIDFSEEAIKQAKDTFPQYNFLTGDITNLEDNLQYDIVFCSNVLEHFYNPWDIFKNLAKISKRYIVLLVPYKEKLKIEEHAYKFDTNLIPMEIDDFKLVYLDTKDGRDIEDSYYPDQQILLIYSNNIDDKKLSYLKDITNGINKSAIKEALESRENDTIKILTNQIETIEMSEVRLKQQLVLYLENEKKFTEQIEEYYNKISRHIASEEVYKAEIVKYKIEIDKHEIVEMDLEKKLNEYREKLNGYLKEDDTIHKQLINQEKENEKNLEAIKTLENELKDLKCTLIEKEGIIQRTISQCKHMLNSRLFKVVHMLNRFYYQGFKGEKLERKKFRKWFVSHVRGGGDADRRFNPLFSLINILNSSGNKNQIIRMDEDNKDNKDNEDINLSAITHDQNLILEQNYTKYDIIIFAVIDYDFRHQRPQHFASSFAKNGHRVFYINANFHNGSGVKKLDQNLNIINFSNNMTTAIYDTDWTDNFNQLKTQLDQLLFDYCIRDAITIVDYPNWVYTAEYLRERYGFKIVTDYMDDFTGFLNPAEDLIRKNCIKLLKTSNMVIPSSQFLNDIAIEYNENIGIVRNGTEFTHFNNAINYKTNKNKKVIGYYGAVSHWFDFDKVCYIAKNLPEHEVIIIGEVTDGASQLKKYPNIKLLGEMPYKDLPEHLAYFDVCLIPFDTSTDLIKATNPVKFYEYLSAGKKIVATEIPELEPFKNKYVYMSNDNEKFLNYVQLCLDGKDTLASFSECVTFGKTNDWQERYEIFASLCSSCVPKVSIIMLTYNNLRLNKLCVDSILNKTAYPRYELIIVDNLSKDGTREYLKELDDKNNKIVKVILNDINSGFAGGNNIGIKESDGDYIVTLNNDTIVTRGWITSLTKALENDKKLGMSGPVTNSIGNESKIKAYYKDINSLEKFAYLYTWDHMQEQLNNANVLALFCTMIKREVIEKCGLLDERYKVGMFEDDDYAEAVKRAGYKLSIVDDAFIHHFDGATFKKLEDENYRTIFEENKEKFEKKWNKKWKMQKYREGVDWNTNIDVVIDE